MATHTVHEDITENGLDDDCPRCAELAERPLELDNRNFIDAWARMIDVEWGSGSYRGDNERKLGKKLYEYAVFVERYELIDPRVLPAVWEAKL